MKGECGAYGATYMKKGCSLPAEAWMNLLALPARMVATAITLPVMQMTKQIHAATLLRSGRPRLVSAIA